MPKTLYILDGHAHLYAAFFAISRLTSPAGEPTNAVYGVVRVLLKLLRERKPDYWAVVLDPPGPTFRDEQFAEYKAHRKPMPDDLRPQGPRLQQVLSAMGVPTFIVPGFEADDIIGTLTKRARAAGIEVVLCSKDKDMGQLLGPGVVLYDTRNDVVIDEKTWTEERGIRPDQVIDYLALMGDASDNIPGAKGIGEKTAAKLISQYGTLANLLAHVGELKGKQKENIEAFAAQAELSRSLATLRCDVPLPVELAALSPRPLDPAKVAPVFQELGFNSLLNELPSGAAGAPVPAGDTPFHKLIVELGLDTARAPTESESAADVSAIPKRPNAPRTAYTTVDTPEKLAGLVAALRTAGRFALDTETTAAAALNCALVGLSFSWAAGEAFYVPVCGLMIDKFLTLSEALTALRPVLEDPAIKKCGQNAKFDMLVLRRHGVEVRGVEFDTMLAAYCIDPARREFNLDALSRDVFGHTKIPTTDVIGKGRKQTTMDQVPVPVVSEYACEDADYTWRLRAALEPALDAAGVRPLFEKLEMPLMHVLADMEAAGITVDPAVLRKMSGELEIRLTELRGRIVAAAGVEFNIDSPKQLGDVLFGKLGLPRGRKTATGTAATDVEVLEELSERHPVPGLVLEYRQLAKLKGTYVDTLPALINRRTGRVHTVFHQAVAQTGRLSSSDPNLQNIPIRTDIGRSIRAAFTAGAAGNVLLTADYSQIELRLLAHFSGDPTLTEAFRNERDIHRFVASQVFAVPESEVNSDMRRKAKAVNFGIIYGQTPFGLSRATGMSPAEARSFIDEYFRRYPKVREFINDAIRLTTQTGYAPTIAGRKRRVEAIDSADRATRGFGERLAVNTVLQGSAADLIKAAMVNIAARIRRENRPGRMLLQIHDELVFELPESAAAAEQAMIVEEMTTALPLKVPLRVDAAVGRNWLEVG
jgi:DNA polymerase-1